MTDGLGIIVFMKGCAMKYKYIRHALRKERLTQKAPNKPNGHF